MKFEQVCQSLNAYFGQHPLFKVLLPLGTPIMLVCVILQEITRFISLGAAMNAITYIGFFLALLLVLSVCNFKMASIGMGIFAVGYLYDVLNSLIRYHYVSYSSIIYMLLFGFFVYQAYRKSLMINK